MWSFLLTDLAGTSLGEIVNASDRKVALPLNRMATASFTIKLDNRHADTLVGGDCLVKAYEVVGKKDDGSPDKRLRFIGEVTSTEEVADEKGGGSIAVVASDALWRLTKRLVGKSATGFSYGSSLDLRDRGEIAKAIIDRVQAAYGTTEDAGGSVGIVVGTIEPSSTTYVGPWQFAKVAEKIAELSTALDGFDFELTPTEPNLWTFNVYTAKGQSQPNAIFEFGTGKKNVKGYRRPVTKDQAMNDGYALPPGFPDNATASIIHSKDDASIAARGRYEDVLTTDNPVDAFRQTLLAEHLRIRATARQTITFDPAINAPRHGVDYTNGDVVTFRAVRNGETRVNASFRVYGAEIAIQDDGRSMTSIELVPS